MTVYLLPENRPAAAEPGETILALLQRLGCQIDAPCGGNGTCGKCRVRILTQRGERSVQACQTEVSPGMRIQLPDPRGAGTQRILAEDRLSGCDAAFPADREADYLAAFDVGTTTVVCYLLEGKTGRELACASMVNPQRSYGADVVSRIQRALRGDLEALTGAIRTGMCALLREACAAAGAAQERIGAVSVVGNPCMQQLLLGISPQNLASPPFPPVLTRRSVRSAGEILPGCGGALLTVPDISGYVGADTVACVLATGMYRREEVTLLVDIGTNGEMVLGGRPRLLACSTAAGPALEGAGIRCGMRGEAGAIDHVWTEDGVLRWSTIGHAAARGICGSGLIDAVAVLLEWGHLDRRGRLLTASSTPLSGHIRPGADGRAAFFLTPEVFLCQEDIRAVQLAKGAIASGIELLAQALGVGLGGIGSVILAGAFGSLIRPESACRIGLLPGVLAGKITAAGNAAGAGAKLIARSEAAFQKAEELARTVEPMELAEMPSFRRSFARNLCFDESAPGSPRL